MANYSAAEEATVFQLIFPFLQPRPPSLNVENIEDQLKSCPTNYEDSMIHPCTVDLKKLKWIGGQLGSPKIAKLKNIVAVAVTFSQPTNPV